MQILRAVAANADGSDIMIHFIDGTISAAKPGDPRLIGIEVAHSGSTVATTGHMLSKLDLYRRLTDAELAAFDLYMQDRSSLRQRMNFAASLDIDKADVQWRSILITLFGPERATQILI